ncbi:murein L,D-transpeptidase [Sphingomonas sp.]|uniref:L,D-transpeptidase family protein n=1 Tax=Sphingomonas sp. TaxID=28214 RepID=UPI0028B2114A|nr:L,D-transpeptidase family protein [Sphingomonas sp.]
MHFKTPGYRRLLAACTILSLASPAIAMQATETGAPPATPDTSLQALATAPDLRRFYARIGWRRVWTDEAVQVLGAAVARRADHGLDRLRFLPEPLPAETPDARDVALTRAALRYAGALAKGVADPKSLQAAYTLPRPDIDLVAGLAKALQRGELQRWLAGLAPGDADYARLSEAYRAAIAEQRQGAGPAPQIAATGLIRPGDRDDRIPAIARQLAAEGYLLEPGTTAPAPSKLYTDTIADAVRALQRDYGLAEDGVIGPRTIDVLTLTPADRARTIAVALERRRWLDRDPPATRIDVNIAAARLTYYRDGVVADTRKVIVGKPGRETPLLSSPIYRLVANPTWTVPKSIENTELAQVGPDYLAAHNMVRRGGYIVQQPGPDNALGLVKFDMANDQAIYLHDTSAPGLFERSQRHLSHGCVRVEDALGFAQRIAEDEGIGDRWQAASISGEQAFVPLPNRIPVRLLYQNAFVDETGRVAVRTDPYDWNGPVARALGFDDGAHTTSRTEAIDIGP